jgi:hypothetical protein
MKHTLFAWQVFLGLPEAYSLHEELKKLVAAAPDEQNFGGKNVYYKRLVALMQPWVGRFDRGIWDYVEDPSAAEDEWKKWTQGTVRDAIEPREGRGPYRGTRENMFVTVLLLLAKGGPSDSFVCERCRMPDDRMWQKGALLFLLEMLPMLNWSSVRGDALYIRPGLSAGSVTEEELGEDHYKYLRVLT